jgi:hypothetical protein
LIAAASTGQSSVTKKSVFNNGLAVKRAVGLNIISQSAGHFIQKTEEKGVGTIDNFDPGSGIPLVHSIGGI